MVKVEKTTIPQALTNNVVVSKRDIKTNKDASILMIDLGNAVAECNKRLDKIKELSDGR